MAAESQNISMSRHYGGGCVGGDMPHAFPELVVWKETVRREGATFDMTYAFAVGCEVEGPTVRAALRLVSPEGIHTRRRRRAWSIAQAIPLGVRSVRGYSSGFSR